MTDQTKTKQLDGIPTWAEVTADLIDKMIREQIKLHRCWATDSPEYNQLKENLVELLERR